MFGNKEVFTTYQSISNETIQLASIATMKAIGIGSVVLKSLTMDREITLHDVLHVPDMHEKNLISVHQLASKGCNVVFSKSKAMVSIDDKSVFEATESKGLYMADLQYSTNPAAHVATTREEPKDTKTDQKQKRNQRTETAEDWHRILGHLNGQDLFKLTDMVNHMHVSTRSLQDCEICAKAKGTRASFTRVKEPEELELGDILATDVGFINKTPYLTITDVASGCSKTWILSAKSEVADKVKDHVLWLDRQFQIKAKVIKSDGGKEFVNKNLQYFAAEHGIELVQSSPYTPEQNGVAERKNRTLKEMARAILLDSGLPETYGPEALLFATFIRNRCPTKSHGKQIQKTPIEMLTGKKPSFKFLQRFGSVCFATLPKQKRQGTLSEKAVKCILIGHTESGYLLEAVDTKKRFQSCHVRFIKGSNQNQHEKEILEDDDSDYSDEDEGAVATRRSISSRLQMGF
jgi:transposase InsO family protein